jgi:hypothetical protein
MLLLLIINDISCKGWSSQVFKGFCLQSINIRVLNSLQTARQRNIKIAKPIWSSRKSTKTKVCWNSSLIPCPPTTSSRMTANCVDKLDHIIMQLPDCTEFLVLVVLIHLTPGKDRLSRFFFSIYYNVWFRVVFETSEHAQQRPVLIRQLWRSHETCPKIS